MKILVACEFSGTVRDAFRLRGHDAWSCDILPTEGKTEFNQYHIEGDVLPHLTVEWDMLIAHPPCTYLANSGVQHMYIGRKPENGICRKRLKNMIEGRDFFMTFFNSKIPKICIENPLPHGFANLPAYSQIVQPYHFGEEAQKKTCLWLKGLPDLKSTKIVGRGEQYFGKNGRPNGSKWYQLPPSKDRAKLRSKTFQSIANAMADQWG